MYVCGKSVGGEWDGARLTAGVVFLKLFLLLALLCYFRQRRTMHKRRASVVAEAAAASATRAS